MKRVRELEDEEEDMELERLGHRYAVLLEQPPGLVTWDELVPDMQNEIIQTMQRLAMTGRPEWLTAIAMLRRTCQQEWNRVMPPLPEPLKKIDSVAAMLAATLRAGDWNLFEELMAWRRMEGKPPSRFELALKYHKIFNAVGYQSDPELYARFQPYIDYDDDSDYIRHNIRMEIVNGVCERGINFAWFKELIRGHTEDVRICEYCAEYGRMEWLLYAREQQCPWDETTCARAAEHGHLDIVIYAHENGCPWHEKTCQMAAKGGHLDILIYAHENDCPWTSTTCNAAARYGHLHVLQYAHENGCPWDTWTSAVAARGGHVNLLRYAHENGCPWDHQTCDMAAEYGHLPALRYAMENGAVVNVNTCAYAAFGGHLDVLQYLHEQHCPWNMETCRFAAFKGHVNVLRYAVEHGCPMPWDRIDDRSIARFSPAIQQYLTTVLKPPLAV